MKTFHRASLPSKIVYNKATYIIDMWATSHAFNYKGHNSGYLNVFKYHGKKNYVLVKVLSSRLKDKTDLHGKSYQPSQWLFRKQLSNN